MSEKQQTSKQVEKAKRIGSPISKRLFTLKEASQYLGRPVSGVRTLIWNGRLPYIQEGRKQYVDLRDLDSYIDKAKTTMI